MKKSFGDECQELGEFRKAYIKKHNLKVLSMYEACKLWREHQGDVDAKDQALEVYQKKIKSLESILMFVEEELQKVIDPKDATAIECVEVLVKYLEFKRTVPKDKQCIDY